ncbi:MAG: aromatic ring-hydroxylating oxygenase subunit alpha [Burkholderiales bacterium]
MQSPLTQRDYLSDEVFSLECERLFKRLWVFAALRQLLAKPHSFATRTIGGVPLVLQNCGGVIKAFENQCLHRQMPLQWEDYGKRPLACRYHGWGYDDTGAPNHIPGQDELYRFTPGELTGMRLRQFAVECVGNLVFVNLAENPMPIAEQFRPSLLARLAAASRAFDDEVIHTRMAANYNWKLNFENVLDGNHVRYLHPGTFTPYLRGSQPAHTADAVQPEPTFQDFERSRLEDLSYESTTAFNVAKRPWHRDVERFDNRDVYYNFFIYPNVNFISVGGYFFLVQQFNPVAPAKTEVSFSLMTAKRIRRNAASAAILWAHLRGEKIVLDEDIRALEKLQAGLHAKGLPARHGAYELQLMKNHVVYCRLMARSAP